MWPVHFAFFLLNVGYSRPTCLYVMLHFSPDRSIGSSPTFSSTKFKTFKVFLIYFLKCPSFSTIHSYALHVALYKFLP
jgi:hypothetical protein